MKKLSELKKGDVIYFCDLFNDVKIYESKVTYIKVDNHVIIYTNNSSFRFVNDSECEIYNDIWVSPDKFHLLNCLSCYTKNKENYWRNQRSKILNERTKMLIRC